jgi:hypothetical protein
MRKRLHLVMRLEESCRQLNPGLTAVVIVLAAIFLAATAARAIDGVIASPGRWVHAPRNFVAAAALPP